jgi:hypothetical protein
MIREHPYIQYFLGYADYRYDISLDPSLLTHFRKRFPADVIAQVNRWVIDAARTQALEEKSSGEEGGDGSSLTEEAFVGSVSESENHGTLILDASCAPQDIQYPTDTQLLHEARQKLEGIMDTLQAGREDRKPHNYCQRANEEYKRFCRNRCPTGKQIRTALRQQFQYVSRNLRLVAEMHQDSTVTLSERQLRNLLCSDRLSSGVFSLFDFTLCTCILLLLRALSKVLLNRFRYWPLCYTRIQSLDLPQAHGPPEVLLFTGANHMNHVSA